MSTLLRDAPPPSAAPAWQVSRNNRAFPASLLRVRLMSSCETAVAPSRSSVASAEPIGLPIVHVAMTGKEHDADVAVRHFFCQPFKAVDDPGARSRSVMIRVSSGA